jgi:uncharacterized repeat protein (TIGR04042 family)
MPALHFTVRWPDGSIDRCYSPSRAVRDYLAEGETYPLADFVGRSRRALQLASDRVRTRHGFACSNAAAQLDAIERAARSFREHSGAHVTVIGFEE